MHTAHLIGLGLLKIKIESISFNVQNNFGQGMYMCMLAVCSHFPTEGFVNNLQRKLQRYYQLCVAKIRFRVLKCWLYYLYTALLERPELKFPLTTLLLVPIL